MSRIVNDRGFVPDAFAGVTARPLAELDPDGEALALAVEGDPETLAELLPRLRLIVIPFAASGDGRGFSLAARLREMGYRGHLRARGHVLVDQLRAARRAGFDDIEIDDAQARRNPPAQWQSVPMSQGYRARLFAG